MLAACRGPAPQAPPPQACPAIAPCDPTITDAAALAVVRTRCWGCHAAGGPAEHDLPDLAALRAAPIADRVGSCAMPPDPMPDPERSLLVRWARCFPAK